MHCLQQAVVFQAVPASSKPMTLVVWNHHAHSGIIAKIRGRPSNNVIAGGEGK